MKPAIIFDLDGTLWDATKTVAESWQEVGRRTFGPSFSLTAEDAMGLMGLTIDEIAKKISLADFDEEEMKTFAHRCASFEIDYLNEHPGDLYEQEEEILSKLNKDYDLYIVSNCENGYIETYLHALKHPEVFKGFLCHGDTKERKGITIRTLLRKCGNFAAIYVGDTEKDEKETRFAGIPFVHASYGFGKAIAPDASIRKLSELIEIAPRIFEQNR